jgi:biofilm protein TabA
MILDTFVEIEKYSHVHPGFSTAFQYLLHNDLNTLTSGRHEIVENKIFAIASIAPGKGITEAKLEVHRKFIDIQCGVAGIDNIGWKSLSRCKCAEGNYDSEKDIHFFSDLPDTWFGLSPETVAIFFPSDAHAPLAVNGMLHKVVIKVAVDY